jgi:hypothetical protein
MRCKPSKGITAVSKCCGLSIYKPGCIKSKPTGKLNSPDRKGRDNCVRSPASKFGCCLLIIASKTYSVPCSAVHVHMIQTLAPDVATKRKRFIATGYGSSAHDTEQSNAFRSSCSLTCLSSVRLLCAACVWTSTVPTGCSKCSAPHNCQQSADCLKR